MDQELSSFVELLVFLKHESDVLKANSLKILLQFLGNDVYVRHIKQKSIETITDILKTVKNESLCLLALPALSILSRDTQLCDKIFFSNSWFLDFIMEMHSKKTLNKEYQEKTEMFIAVLLSNLTFSPGGTKLFLEKEFEEKETKQEASKYFYLIINDVLFSKPGLCCPYFLNVIINSTSYNSKCREFFFHPSKEREREEILLRISTLFEKRIKESSNPKDDSLVRLNGFCHIFKNLSLEEKYLHVFEKSELIKKFIPILKAAQKGILKSGKSGIIKPLLEILFALTKNFSILKQIFEEKEYFEYLIEDYWSKDVDELNEKNPEIAELKLLSISIHDVLLMNESVIHFKEGEIMKVDQ